MSVKKWNLSFSIFDNLYFITVSFIPWNLKLSILINFIFLYLYSLPLSLIFVNILNNISFSYSKNNVYKFDGESLSNVISSQNYMNNYELKDVDGLNTSLRNSDFENKIILVSSKNINKEFFEKKLSWSSKIWNLNNGKLPKLSNHDPNKIQSIK